MASSRRILRRLICLPLLLVMACASADDKTLQIQFQRTYQEIEGFGASDAWSIDPAISKWSGGSDDDSVTRLADLLFSTDSGIGLSAWRFNIGAGSVGQGEASRITDPYRRAELLVPAPGAPVDSSKQAGQVRFLREAHKRGVQTFVAFANSPPHWATKNGLTHAAKGTGVGSTNLAENRVDDFSNFLVQVLNYLRGEEVNVPVNYISPANEPTWHWENQSQEGNRYNNQDLKTLYRSLHKALSEAGLERSVEIDGPEVPEYRAALDDDLHRRLFGKDYREGMNKTPNGEFKNYIDAFAGDPEMQQILGNKLSLHAYFSEATEQHLGPLRDALVENLSRVSPPPELWMSEYCVLGDPGDVRDFDGHGFDVTDYHVAEHIARILHRDLSRLNVTAWFWWLALTPYDYKDGLVRVSPDLDPATLQPSKVMWVLGQYSRFIRPGYQRIAAPGFDDLHGLMASAYRSREQDKIVVVVVNAGDSAESLALDYIELPAGYSADPIVPYITDAEHNLARSPKLLMQHDRLFLPAHSVVSLEIDLVEDTP